MTGDREALSLPAALAAFAAALALMVALAPLTRGLGAWGMALSQLVAIAAPTLFVAARRARSPARALGLRMPPGRALAGATLVGLSFWYLNLALLVPLNEALVGDDASVTRLAEILSEPGLPFAAKLLVVALLPALCEELLFRGALARALRPLAGVAGAVALQAVLFSLFHISPARLLPILAFGVVLGAIALLAASTLASALTHVLNNAMAVSLATPAADPAMNAIEGHPGATTATAATATVLGLWLIVCARGEAEARAGPSGS